MDNRRKKDIKDFVSLVATSERKVYSYILAMVLSYQDADDLLQETLLYLWDEFDKFEPGTSFVSWAMAVARYRVLEYFRRKKIEKRILLTDAIAEEYHKEVEKSVENLDQYLDTLKNCVKKLPASDKNLLTERYEENESVKCIADKSDVTVQNVYQKLARIKLALYRCIKYTLAVD